MAILWVFSEKKRLELNLGISRFIIFTISTRKCDKKYSAEIFIIYELCGLVAGKSHFSTITFFLRRLFVWLLSWMIYYLFISWMQLFPAIVIISSFNFLGTHFSPPHHLSKQLRGENVRTNVQSNCCWSLPYVAARIEKYHKSHKLCRRRKKFLMLDGNRCKIIFTNYF